MGTVCLFSSLLTPYLKCKVRGYQLCRAYLILANGRVFRGVSVGCPGTTIGEVVFGNRYGRL